MMHDIFANLVIPSVSQVVSWFDLIVERAGAQYYILAGVIIVLTGSLFILPLRGRAISGPVNAGYQKIRLSRSDGGVNFSSVGDSDSGVSFNSVG